MYKRQDKDSLLTWISAFEQKPRQVFVVHGEDSSCTLFSERVKKELGIEAMAPYSGTVYDLASGRLLREAPPVRIQKKAAASGSRQNTVFDRLLAAGQRLLAVIRHNEGGANKDLAKFADQIDALCDKWER